MPIPAFTDPPTTSRAPYTYVPPPPSPKPESEKNLPFLDAKLRNDCLLTADQGQVLTGLPKLTPRQEHIPKRDGEFIDACYYEVVQPAAPGGALNIIVPLPKMEIDVYKPVPGWSTDRVLDRVDGKPSRSPADAASCCATRRATRSGSPTAPGSASSACTTSTPPTRPSPRPGS